MNEKNRKRRRSDSSVLLLLTLLFMLPGAPSRAEGYGDQSLYDLTKVPDRVLIDAVGFVVIKAEIHAEKPAAGPAITVTGFPIFERASARFVFSREILFSETFPIGRIGWGASYRYLLTGREGEHLQVVIDPYADRRAWIKLNEKNGDRAIVFADREGRAKPVTEEIEIFPLSQETRLFSAPRTDAKSIVLRQYHPDRTFYPAAFKGDFVQIGVRRLTDGGDLVDDEPMGWIQARDERGRLAFHLYMASWD